MFILQLDSICIERSSVYFRCSGVAPIPDGRSEDLIPGLQAQVVLLAIGVFHSLATIFFCSSSKDGFIFTAQTTCPSLHTFLQLSLLSAVLSLPCLPGLVGRHSFCQELFQTP